MMPPALNCDSLFSKELRFDISCTLIVLYLGPSIGVLLYYIYCSTCVNGGEDVRIGALLFPESAGLFNHCLARLRL